EPFRANQVAKIKKLFARAWSEQKRYLSGAGNNDVSDELAAMENAFDRARATWPSIPGPDRETSSVLASSIECGRQLDELIYVAAQTKIPPRVARSMHQLRVGGVLNFHEAFVDELPDKKDRDRLLAYLARYPEAYYGLVNSSNGLIYHVAEKHWRRVAS